MMGRVVHSLRDLMSVTTRSDTLPDYISIGRGTFSLERNSFSGLAPECPVTVGNGAGAVVSSDIAPYSVNLGVPARHIRMHFEAAQNAALSEIAWSDWPEETIRVEITTFCSDMDSFIARAGEISR